MRLCKKDMYCFGEKVHEETMGTDNFQRVTAIMIIINNDVDKGVRRTLSNCVDDFFTN